MSATNKLVLIGNGFDLAHGLKTSYKNFLDWYMCKAFIEYRTKGKYIDSLIEMDSQYPLESMISSMPKTSEEVERIFSTDQYQYFKNPSIF